MEDFLFLDAPPTSSYYKKYKWFGDDIPDDQESANQVDSYGAQGLGDSECFSTMMLMRRNFHHIEKQNHF